jgi:sec-independent protein translocase protein TatA
MPQIGPLEILVVMVVALLVFGPEKLPEMARNLGRTATQLRRMAQDMKDEFATALDDEDEDRSAPASGVTRPRVAGALPREEPESATEVASEDADAGAADERSSINDDLRRLNQAQQDTEAATGSAAEPSGPSE